MGEKRRFRCKRCRCSVGRWAYGGSGWKHFTTRFRKSCGIQPTDDDVEPLPESTLRCNVCEKERPLSQFYRNRSIKRGYAYSCKPCMKKYENLEQRRRSNRLYYTAHLDRSRAREKSRRVLPKDRCERCGATDRLHKHHPDYTQPLNVLTLCVPCHERAHHG
jgi:hypothetical protein